MLAGKQTVSENQNLTTRLVADAVYQHLFGHRSYFLTQIACIKKKPTMRNKRCTQLCLLDPATHHQRIALQDNRILVAPNWTRIALGQKPWLAVSDLYAGQCAASLAPI